MVAIWRLCLSFGVLKLLILSAAIGLDYENRFRRVESLVEGDGISSSGFRSGSDGDLVALFDSIDVREKDSALSESEAATRDTLVHDMIALISALQGSPADSSTVLFKEELVAMVDAMVGDGENEAESEVPSSVHRSLFSEEDQPSSYPTLSPLEAPSYRPTSDSELQQHDLPTAAITLSPIDLMPTPAPSTKSNDILEYNTSTTASPSNEPIPIADLIADDDERYNKDTAVRVTASILFCAIMIIGLVMFFHSRAPQSKAKRQGYCHRADSYGRFTEEEVVIELPDSLSVIKRNPLQYDSTPTSQVDYWGVVEKGSYASTSPNGTDPIARAVSVNLTSLNYEHVYYYSDDGVEYEKDPSNSCAV
eukprot:gene25386-33930_t